MPADSQARVTSAKGKELCSALAKGSSADGRHPSSNLFPGFNPRNSQDQGFMSMKKGGNPSRFLFLRDESWADFTGQVLDVLKAGFVAGKTALKVVVDGERHLFDFLRMLQISLLTGARNFIAWIDVDGQCFFPKPVVDEQRSVACPKREIDFRWISHASLAVPSVFNSLKGKRDLLDCPEDCSFQGSSNVSPDRKRWPGVCMMNYEDKTYKFVENSFLAGIRSLAPDTVITSISKCSYSGSVGNYRLKVFKMQLQMTKAARGDANVQFGWYGAPAESIAGAIADGFRIPVTRTLGCDACGIGIHLSPSQFSYASSLRSDADCNGERHVILCRVIMGKSERIQAGSLQLNPSSDLFDTGVDDLVNPRWYIVWSTHMDTHILPEYVVSFKSSMQPQGSWRTTSPAKKPLSFVKLLAEIVRSVSPSRRQALKIQYDQYKVGKISKIMFIRCIRSIAGDELLISTISRIQGH